MIVSTSWSWFSSFQQPQPTFYQLSSPCRKRESFCSWLWPKTYSDWLGLSHSSEPITMTSEWVTEHSTWYKIQSTKKPLPSMPLGCAKFNMVSEVSRERSRGHGWGQDAIQRSVLCDNIVPRWRRLSYAPLFHFTAKCTQLLNDLSLIEV